MSGTHVAVHIVILLTLPPLALGIIGKTKAFFAGRQGAPLLQPYFDLARLLQKGMVLSRTTTWLFLAGPVVGLTTTFFAALLLPMGGHPAPIAFAGDFVLFAYLLGLGRFFTILAALDTGSAFEGMGGAREAAFGSLAEPALFFGFMVLSRATGSSSLSAMLGPSVTAVWASAGATLAALVVSWFVVLLAENSRIPFDDPNTHLELTMVHEVMILDHSGAALGLIEYGAAMKLFVFSSLVLGLVVPLHLVGPWYSWGLLPLTVLGLAIVVGIVESIMARLRLTQIPALLIGACMIAAFGAVLLVR